MRLLATALIAVTSLLPIAACSAADSYAEGTDYTLVRTPASAPGSKKIKVEEVFWYGCGHCYAFEPTIEAWAAKVPGDVDFVRVPNSLGRPVVIIHSKTYYTAEVLNLLGKSHVALFDAIHKEHLPLETPEAIQAWFTDKFGIMPDLFNNTFNGFTVDSRTRSAEELARQYGVASTPTIIVDGRFQVNASQAKGFDGMIKVTNFLIDTKLPGIEVRKIATLGQRAIGTTQVFYSGVKVPASAVLGKVDHGWEAVDSYLWYERLCLSAARTGAASAAFEYALDYAKNRRQFGRPIGQFQAISHKLADMKVMLDVSRTLVYRFAWLLAQGQATRSDAAVLKLYTGETYKAVSDLGLQILGGYGYCMEYPMQRFFRDSRLAVIGAGTSEIQRNIIARGLGL